MPRALTGQTAVEGVEVVDRPRYAIPSIRQKLRIGRKDRGQLAHEPLRLNRRGVGRILRFFIKMERESCASFFHDLAM
jgi:hypothetical protein